MDRSLLKQLLLRVVAVPLTWGIVAAQNSAAETAEKSAKSGQAEKSTSSDQRAVLRSLLGEHLVPGNGLGNHTLEPSATLLAQSAVPPPPPTAPPPPP